MKDYTKEIDEFNTNYQDMRIDIDDNVNYDLRNVVLDESRLYNAMYKGGTIEATGYKRQFIRKAWVVYRTLIQGSDVDLKNLFTKPLQLAKVRLVAFLRMLFISILTRRDFGEKMDDILSYMCWHGTALVKRHGEGVDLIDLRNYVTEPHEPDPQKRRHMESQYYTYSKIKKFKKDWGDNWSAVEDLWELMQAQGVSTFRVIEFQTWGSVEEDGETTKIMVKALDNNVVDLTEAQNPDDWQASVQLDVFELPKVRNPFTWKKEPVFTYTQFDLFRVPGRFKSLGVGELLSGPSEMYNKLWNNEMKMNNKALQGLYTHHASASPSNNPNSGGDVLSQSAITNLPTGGVIPLKHDEKLLPLPVDTRAGDFDLMEQKIYELMRQIIGITAQGTGEEQPASTSATQAAINKETQNTVFDFVRERFHFGIDKLFNMGYAQDIVEQLDQEQVVAITGDNSQLEQLDMILIDNAVNNWLAEIKKTGGRYPTPEEVQEEKERLKQDMKELGDSRFPEIKKQLLDDLPYLVEFGTQQEAYDTKFRSDALLAMLADPNFTGSRKKVYDELFVSQGLNPREYDKTPVEIEEEQRSQQQAMQQAQQGVQVPQPVV